MLTTYEMTRDTWSDDRKYLIRAYARFIHPCAGVDVKIATANVMVYEGDPDVNDKYEIFFCPSFLRSSDLLDELQNAERIGRDFVDLMR